MKPNSRRGRPGPWLAHGKLAGMLGCWVFLVAVGATGVAGADSVDRPNVLILLADDLGSTDLSVTGSKWCQTPRLDQLARDGVRFESFYSGAPNCSPSRAALLTGRIPARTGLYNYIPPHGPLYLPESERTVAELLQSVGYSTAHVGKWHLCHDLLDADLPQARDHGFDVSWATANNAAPNHLNPNNFVRDGEAVGPLEGYSCDIVAGKVCDWLRQRPQDRPFFVCAWFHETHTPIASPPELVQRHLDRGATKKQAAYRANVENLDRAIGTILDVLDELECSKNTIVWFASDNGGLHSESNDGLRGRKSKVFEGGIRVPGIVRGPGIGPAGRVCPQPAGLVDVLPTLCDAAGVDLPDDRAIDGVSLLPVMRVESAAVLPRSVPLFWYFYRVTPACALRDGRFALVGYLGDGLPKSHPLNAAQMVWLKKTPLERFELYDLVADPAQETDVAAAHPEVFKRLQTTMLRLHREVLDEGPVWFD